MNHLVKKYGKFLNKSSELFAVAAKKHNVACRRGCHECCATGFFDITLLDAIYLRSAIKKAPAPVRERILKRCEEQLDVLEKKKAFSRKDPILKTNEDIDVVSRRSAKVLCPALENGVCLIYDHRPHICRIFGPTIRGSRRAVRLEGCGYFKKEIPEADLPILDNYEEENKILLELYTAAGRKRIREVDTIIPAGLTMDLKKWL